MAVACWIAAWSGVVTMLTLNGGIAMVTLLQVVMFIAAVSDLWLHRSDPAVRLPAQPRLLALLVPVVIAFLGYRMLHAPIAHEAERHAEAVRRVRPPGSRCCTQDGCLTVTLPRHAVSA
jgi:hypothetical protein